MSSTAAAHTTWPEAWKQAWERFWFTPADTRPLALMRITVGIASLWCFLSFSADLTRWFGPQGLLSSDAAQALSAGSDEAVVYRFSLLNLARSSTELWIVHGVCIAAAAALIAGLATRISCVLTLVGVLSYVHRAPVLGSLLDPVLTMFLFYLCFAPAGAVCSVDRLLGMPTWLRGNELSSLSAAIPLRLMQVHLVALYAVMGAAKLYGDWWWDGEAIWSLMAQTHSRPVDLSALRGWGLFLNAWTHLIAFTHLAFAALVWNRLTRPIVLVLATVTWLSLIPVTGQTLLCLLMAAASLIYIRPAASDGPITP